MDDDSNKPGRSQEVESDDWVKQTSLYKEFIAEREEILRHKWLESEKAGQDIGFERALVDWVAKYRTTWRRWRQESASKSDGSQ
ncbi:MAG: hypothetical protein A2107_02390 [Verrucomicrobia bacterium GWF2_62_7]|nr:MAG: hypothetical protein A2107_02390 [Verrucomicrobia bacterium GWF2_62_7]